VSTIKSITASIIQGSSVGPAAYVVNASDLNAVTPGNQLCKFADDTCLVVPASNVESTTPPPMTDIVRVTSLKILGVTMTNGLSASEHVRDITRSCAQTLYALRVLRTHGIVSEGAADHLPVSRNCHIIKRLERIYQSD